MLPRSFQYAPRAMFSARHSGSRGTQTSSQRRATRAISATACSGSGTCSRTSMAVAASNSSSAKGRFSAFITRYSRFGAGALGPLGVQARVVEVDADDAAPSPAAAPTAG